MVRKDIKRGIQTKSSNERKETRSGREYKHELTLIENSHHAAEDNVLVDVNPQMHREKEMEVPLGDVDIYPLRIRTRDEIGLFDKWLRKNQKDRYHSHICYRLLYLYAVRIHTICLIFQI